MTSTSASSRSASRRRPAGCRWSQAPARTTRSRRSNSPSSPRRPAPTGFWSSRPITTSRTRRASTLIIAAIARSVSLPIIIYNIPGRSVIDMTPETMGRLAADFSNIVGVKDATAKVERVSRAAADLRPGLHPAVRRGRHGARLQRPWRSGLHLGDGECRAEAVRRSSRRPALPATTPRRWRSRTS